LYEDGEDCSKESARGDELQKRLDSVQEDIQKQALQRLQQDKLDAKKRQVDDAVKDKQNKDAIDECNKKTTAAQENEKTMQDKFMSCQAELGKQKSDLLEAEACCTEGKEANKRVSECEAESAGCLSDVASYKKQVEDLKSKIATLQESLITSNTNQLEVSNKCSSSSYNLRSAYEQSLKT